MVEGNLSDMFSKPKNGIDCFFTEASYTRWLGEDSHEKRLAENFSKIGIKYPVNGGHGGKEKESSQETESKIEKPIVPAHKHPVKRKSISKPRENNVKENITNTPDIANIKTELDPNTVEVLDDANENFSDVAKPEEIPAAERDLNIATDNADTIDPGADLTAIDNDSLEMHTESRPHGDYSNAGFEDGNQNHQDVVIAVAGTSSDFEQERLHSKQKATDMHKEIDNFKTERTDNCTSREISFEKDRKLNVQASTAEHFQENTDGKKPGKPKVDLSSQVYNSKESKHCYIPEIVKRKPEKISLIGRSDQKFYLDNRAKYELSTEEGLTPEELQERHKFKFVESLVKKEQKQFQENLCHISRKCFPDYKYLPAEGQKYIQAKFLGKMKRLMTYPRYYTTVNKMVLPFDSPDTPYVLQYVRPLLELGSACKIVLPELLPGKPQPCLPPSTVEKYCPALDPVLKGPCVWNHEEISRDSNAEQLAVPNRCDIALSASAITCLVDNQAKKCKSWMLPVTIREYDIMDGDKKTTHRVVYIDKPFIKETEFVGRDRSTVYQKYALKSVALRPKQRIKVFSNIKPVVEEQRISVDRLQAEVEHFKESVTETAENLSDEDIFLDDVDDDNVLNKRKGRYKIFRKLGNAAGNKKGGVGVFDVDQEIEDLETFGMDVIPKGGLGSSGRNEKMKTLPLKLLGKRKKSEESDFDLFKNELQDIKRKAVVETQLTPRSATVTTLSDETDDVKTLDKEELVEDTVECKKDDSSTQDKELSKAEELGCQDNLATEETEGAADVGLDFEEKAQISDETNAEEAAGGAKNEEEFESLAFQRKTRQTLSLKNVSSISEKMKQMSVIKSKLRIRSNSQESEDLPVVQYQAVKSYPTKNPRRSTRSTASAIRNTPADDDSDNIDSDDGLIIDDPEAAKVSDIPEGPQSPGSTPESPPASPVLDSLRRDNDDEMMETNDCRPKRSCVIIPLEEENVDTVIRDYSAVKYEFTGKSNELGNMAKHVGQITGTSNNADETGVKAADIKKEQVGDFPGQQDCSSPVTRGAKKRSIGNNSEELTASKRMLRSASASGSESPQKVRKKSGYQTRSALSKERQDVTESDKEMSGEGQKKELTKERLTRSRSVSAEDISEGPSTSGFKRVTRKSLESTQEDIKRDTNPEAGVKRKRGRPPLRPKSDGSIKTEVEELKTETKMDGTEVSLNDDTAVSSEGVELKNVETDTVAPSPRRRGRPPKQRSDAEAEAKKIKELVKANRVKEAKVNNTAAMTSDAGVTGDNDVNTAGGGKGTKPDKRLSNVIEEETGHSISKEKSEEKGKGSDLDKLLNLQTEMFKLPANLPSTAGSFASRHLMSHVKFPASDNVTYHQWNISDINILIRCSYHGFSNPQGLVHLTTKMEYQPYFGFEKETLNETARNWISVYIRPNSSLVRARVNPFNNEVMLMEHIPYPNLIPESSRFSQSQAFSDLNHTFQNLKQLPAGQYILRNNPLKMDTFTILKATDVNEKGTFDLHHHQVSQTGRKPFPISWNGIDFNMLLPHHRKMNLVPGTYKPRDGPTAGTEGQKKKKKRNRKKKLKGKTK